jgi:hypothetical protein
VLYDELVAVDSFQLHLMLLPLLLIRQVKIISCLQCQHFSLRGKVNWSALSKDLIRTSKTHYKLRES